MRTDDEVTLVVTPTLFVGDRATLNFETTLVASSQEAVAVIESGGSARLPSGAWNEAAEVLRTFGLTEAEVADRIHFARTGRILRQS